MKRVECKCLNCGKIFEVIPSDIKYGKGKYCSKECRLSHKPKTIKCKCLYCGADFTRHLSMVKLGHNKYCSRKCSGQAKSKKITLECKFCGKQFTAHASDVNYNKKFCSKECYIKANSGYLSRWWAGGRFNSFGLSWQTQRRLAYERDQGICQYCGLTELEAKDKHRSINSVHHIVKRRWFKDHGISIEESNQLTNLITLCKSCHRRAEAGKITLQPKLL